MESHNSATRILVRSTVNQSRSNPQAPNSSTHTWDIARDLEVRGYKVEIALDVARLAIGLVDGVPRDVAEIPVADEVLYNADRGHIAERVAAENDEDDARQCQDYAKRCAKDLQVLDVVVATLTFGSGCYRPAAAFAGAAARLALALRLRRKDLFDACLALLHSSWGCIL